MLRPIHRVVCSPALAACQRMMRQLSLWLCQPATLAASVTQQNLQPPVLTSAIEANWLWAFLQRIDAGQSLLTHAQTLADMPIAEKTALSTWVQVVAGLSAQFQPAPAAWPVSAPAISPPAWQAFKALMEAFYAKAFKSTGGLPYLADGTPTGTGGVTYADYVKAFRDAHRLNPDPSGREVCVLCGGPLGDTPHVDHWIIKSAFPLISVCADNLQLICSTCNEAPNKGDKPVHSAGNYADWFHPYLRPGNGTLRLDYLLPELAVRCSATTPADQVKVENLDALLNLSSRWTKEFKAEYLKQQNVLFGRERRRILHNQPRHSRAEILTHVQQWQDDLLPSEPHHEVHLTLAAALQELARMSAWHTELQSL